METEVYSYVYSSYLLCSLAGAGLLGALSSVNPQKPERGPRCLERDVRKRATSDELLRELRGLVARGTRALFRTPNSYETCFQRGLCHAMRPDSTPTLAAVKTVVELDARMDSNGAVARATWSWRP